MSKAIRTTPSLVVSLVLFSALTMAQPGGNNAKKDKNKEHHSRFAKVAFWRHHWRHHKDADKNAKQAQATQAPSKPAHAKTAEIKPVSTKQAPGKLLGHHPDSGKNHSHIPPAVEQRQKPAASITSENTHNDAHTAAASKSKSRRREDYIAKDTFVQYGRDGKPIP